MAQFSSSKAYPSLYSTQREGYWLDYQLLPENMTIRDLVRDAPAGQLIRYATKNRHLRYPEEEAGFKLPDCWLELLNNPDRDAPSPAHHDSSSDSPVNGEKTREHGLDGGSHTTSNDEKASPPNGNGEKRDEAQGHGHTPTPPDQAPSASRERLHLHRTGTGSSTRAFTQERLEEEAQHDLERTKSVPIVPKRTRDGAILVDWYYSDDPENPHNWSNSKRLGVTLIICFYTFVVYTTSAIYVSSEVGVQRVFGVSEIKSTLGLSIYVLGYGIGPLIFSPLSEIPVIGRNPVYIATMWLFVILSIPTAFAQNYAGLMVLRFLTGFFGSPCLASGGASLGDIYSLMSLPYAMMAWVAAAYCGRKTFSPLYFYNTILTMCSCSGAPPVRFRRARQVLALVPLRVHLGCRPRGHHNVLPAPRDQLAEPPASPGQAPPQAHRQRPIHVAIRDRPAPHEGLAHCRRRPHQAHGDHHQGPGCALRTGIHCHHLRYLLLV